MRFKELGFGCMHTVAYAQAVPSVTAKAVPPHEARPAPELVMTSLKNARGLPEYPGEKGRGRMFFKGVASASLNPLLCKEQVKTSCDTMHAMVWHAKESRKWSPKDSSSSQAEIHIAG
jgi:hypothetical protein